MGKDNKVLTTGVISRGIKTPIVTAGDDLANIVISSVVEAVGEIQENAVIAVTEAVVAIAQGNFVTHKDISDDISVKFEGAKELVLVDPIQSRNRFMDVLKAVAATPTLEKIYISMTYPTDEVGNRFISNEAIMESGINPYRDLFTVEEFYEKFGEPSHPFTGKNYIKEYLDACNGKAEVILCNDFSQLKEKTGCDDFLVCSIHRREETKKVLEKNGENRVLDLSQIMNAPLNEDTETGFNEKFGLYGSNLMSGGRLKLMPRNCDNFVMVVQSAIKDMYGVHVEVMVYGDGAFKDPVGGIWELADPVTTLGATSGLKGTPKEVKLKFIASANEGKTKEELEEIVKAEVEKRKNTEEITGEASLGTTPRQITDLLASLADLTTGSGNRQTPVVYIENYL